MKSIYNYFNYQEFLSEWFRHQKSLKTGVTLQSVTSDIGLKSRSYLHRVIQGKGALSAKLIPDLCRILTLNPAESNYFSLLVAFKHVKSDSERLGLLAQIEVYAHPDIVALEKKKYSYFSKWYIPALRELVTTLEFDDDYQKLGRALVPVIPAKEAREAVVLLQELGLIEREGVRYRQTSSILLAKSDIDFLALRMYQKEMIDLAKSSVDRFEPGDRETLSISAGLSMQGYGELKSAVQEFQKRVLSIIQQHESVEVACQINTQIFPISKQITSKGIHYEK